MKNIFYIVCLVLFLVSSIDAREVSLLEERDGVMYEPNKEESFTGRYVTYYENGHFHVTFFQNKITFIMNNERPLSLESRRSECSTLMSALY